MEKCMERKGIILLMGLAVLIGLFFGVSTYGESLWVIDDAGVLSAKTKNYINKMNDTDLQGVPGKPQYVVEVLPELPKGEDIDSYKVHEFERLKIGQKEQDNGLLFVVAIEDRKYGLEVGYGLEDVIIDSYHSIIVNDQVKANLKDEDYDQAVYLVSKKINDILTEKITSEQLNEEVNKESEVPLFLKISLAIIATGSGISIVGYGIYRKKRKKELSKILKKYPTNHQIFLLQREIKPD